ncbi:hypothetical protein PU560_05665, partial [Georgenia sp. 10Sc9-8]|nr:hypothetical protein [Georgenia halotolerans]
MHGRPSWRGAARGTSAAILAGALAVTAAPATYAATDLPDPVVVEGDDWTVEQVPGGYELTLELDDPLPMRAAAPVLEVDGEPVGLARESADGGSVSVITTDESILAAEDVDLSWDGEAESAPRSIGPQSVDPEDSDDAVEFDPPRLDVDPSENGDYTVARADYDLGTQAIDLEEIGGVKGEMRAAVYYPVEA